jgi:predicted NAD-dependent protein-ADP-ribosyltransferase YbiA (DUF1768 family)
MTIFNDIELHDVRSLSEAEKKNEFQKLIGTINLHNDEDYDCSKLNIWSYRKGTDIRNGINIKFGNMCNGFPYNIDGVKFFNSECAYIAGAYGNNDPDSIRIQNEISKMSNGYKCKKIYRNRPEITKHLREDWNDYNVQWMIYVVWQKCLNNKDFASLMKRIPVDGHSVENTTGMNGNTSTFWGAKNKELMAVRKEAEDKVAKNRIFRYKKELTEAQMLAAYKINDIGHFTGKNVMGKIIKICSLSLYYNQVPPIDYSLLLDKKLYMLGNLMNFVVN